VILGRLVGGPRGLLSIGTLISGNTVSSDSILVNNAGTARIDLKM
jgi:hypothetical protein